MNSLKRGKYGEDLAVSFLEEKGFEIVERNYRYLRDEIDIIGLLNNELLVFFEVKLRKSNGFGEPETFVSENQRERIREAAEAYIYDINWTKGIRFDILSVLKDQIDHFEDAF